MASISDELSVEEMIAEAKKFKHRRLPIYDETPDTIVGILNSFGDVADIPGSYLSVQRLVRGHLGQVSTSHIVHGKIMVAIAFAALIYGDDVGMIEFGRAARLGVKSLHLLRAGQRPGTNHLDGNGTVQMPLPAKIHDPHASPSQYAFQHIISELAGQHGQR